jgi:RsiW-degrading membrane proteinase PrsW (M82 family)
MSPARSLVGLGLMTAAVLALTAAGFGGGVFLVAAAVALLPLPIYIGVVLWLDRFEPEPRGMLAMAFLWGASVAVVVSGLVNGVMDEVIGAGLTSIVTAPVVEEALKAVVLVRFYRRRRDEFDGVVDGLIYAAMVGLGFAFAENVDYYGRALQKDGMAGLAVTFTLRAVIAPFSHPLFTGFTGLGLGLARQSRRRWVVRAAPIAGFAGAVGLHAIWNAGASAGLIFFAVYVLLMIPALGALLVTVAVALKFEGRVIRAQLAPEAATGLLAADEYARLCSVRGRMHASATALRQGGPAAWRARRGFHRAASELAFLRHRSLLDGTAADPALEAGYLALLGAAVTPAGADAPSTETAGASSASPALETGAPPASPGA